MASVDTVSDREHVESVGPGDDVSGGFDGAQIDMIDAGALEIVAGLGGGSSDGSYDLNIQDAADDGNGNPDTWSDVASDNLLGSFSSGVQADAGISERVAYVGFRRFVRVQVVENSAAGTAPTVYAVGVQDDFRGFV